MLCLIVPRLVENETHVISLINSFRATPNHLINEEERIPGAVIYMENSFHIADVCQSLHTHTPHVKGVCKGHTEDIRDTLRCEIVGMFGLGKVVSVNRATVLFWIWNRDSQTDGQRAARRRGEESEELALGRHDSVRRSCRYFVFSGGFFICFSSPWWCSFPYYV